MCDPPVPSITNKKKSHRKKLLGAQKMKKKIPYPNVYFI